MLFFLPFLFGCITRDDIKPFDYEPGKAQQEALIRKNFSDVDIKRDPAALQAAVTGHRAAVSAAWWGFNGKDDTQSLQAAFDSGARVVLIPAMESAWVSTSVYIKSDTTVIFEQGSELVALRGAFRERTAMLLNISDVHNVTVYGYGATLRMWKEDYSAPPYSKAEWRSTIQIRGASNIAIFGLRAEKSGGDGVYLGRGKSFVNTDITLKDLILKDHYRQGISVISAENLLIENVDLTGTNGTAPASGIDFEPNKPDESLINCRLVNCLLRGNSGAGFLVALQHFDSETLPVDITLEGCLIYGNSFAVAVFGCDNGVRGKISFRNCKINGLIITPFIPVKTVTITYQ